MRHSSSPHLHSRPWPTDILPDMLLAVLVCSSECRVGERISLQQNARDCAIHRVDNLFFVYPFMKSYHRFPSHHGSAISRACATMIDIPSLSRTSARCLEHAIQSSVLSSLWLSRFRTSSCLPYHRSQGVLCVSVSLGEDVFHAISNTFKAVL
ncbi:hypothetical protein AcW1_004079 [Taiwanofungus camphoratus]|nr:hypothetical protein AcW1_004079 [Antrodia cinnamomea]